MASLASAVAIFEPFLAFVLLSNARFVLFCLISFALRATPEKRVCLRFRLAIYVFSLSLAKMAVDKRDNVARSVESLMPFSGCFTRKLAPKSAKNFKLAKQLAIFKAKNIF